MLKMEPHDGFEPPSAAYKAAAKPAQLMGLNLIHLEHLSLMIALTVIFLHFGQ